MNKSSQGRSKNGASNKSSGRQASAGVRSLFGSSISKTGLDADWSEVDPVLLRDVIWAVDFLGGAITFSTTRNGKAYVFKVYMGEPFDPMYFDGDEEGRAEMRAWVESLVATAAAEG